jgi:3-oxoacyl-[acyl-carrier-protein] synthase-3
MPFSARLNSVGILGLGAYVPERVLTNADLEKLVETSDQWIVERTGIRERRIAAEGQSTADLAVAASAAAIADAGLSADDIDLVVCCTSTPDLVSPSTGCLIQDRLGMKRQPPAFDLSAACSGFVFGAAAAAAFIRSGFARHALVVGAEAMSRVIDFADRGTCILFGDGAGAAVLGPCADGRGLVGQALGSDGSGGGLLTIPAIGATANGAEAPRPCYLTMQGNEVYKFATRIFGQAIEDALRDAGGGLSPADLDLIVPHQANVRIIDAAAKRLRLPHDRFVVNIEKYGNTSAATVPIALLEARDAGRLRDGALVALVAFGGGLTYGANIWRWSDKR